MNAPANIEQALKNLRFPDKAIIAGRSVDAASGETFDCVSPVDGRVLARIPACGAEDVDRAVKAARAAFDNGVWSAIAPRQRKKVLQRFARLIREHGEELALLETLDMGKPIAEARSIDVAGTVHCLTWFAESCDKIYDELAPVGPGAVGMITREPIGVVAAVVPWNYPMLMASWKLGPALAAGNSVILKPAEQSPLSAIRLGELAREAGLPDGVLQVLPGFGETAGQALGRHMDVDMVAFTGSTEVGRYFLRYAGESNMKHVSLECGGKSPNIVFADAGDLDEAAKQAALGVFHNAGQVCTAATRLLVEEKIHDAFLERVVAIGRKMQPKNPLDDKARLGAVVDATQLDRILDYVEVGRKEGASLVLGGERVMADTGGVYMPPTIFDRVDNKMRIAQEEIFGPVISTITFREPDEALRIANDTIYGLAASVWTNDINKAHRLARGLRAGKVCINNVDGGDITLPFGGYKQSGIGRDNSLHAYDKYTQLKTTYIALS
ncbi:MAG: aldehyde dehydrogenase [Flavobacteriaceae bacterium]